jgi:hypothetical protein
MVGRPARSIKLKLLLVKRLRIALRPSGGGSCTGGAGDNRTTSRAAKSRSTATRDKQGCAKKQPGVRGIAGLLGSLVVREVTSQAHLSAAANRYLLGCRDLEKW